MSGGAGGGPSEGRRERRHGSARCPLPRRRARAPRPRGAVAARRSRHRSRPALRRRRRFLVACRECRSRIITAGRSACQMDSSRLSRHDVDPRTHPRGASCRTCSFLSISATASPLARRCSRFPKAAASRTWPARRSIAIVMSDRELDDAVVARLGRAGADKVLLCEGAGLASAGAGRHARPCACRPRSNGSRRCSVLFPAGGAGMTLGPSLAARIGAAFAGAADLEATDAAGPLADGVGRVLLRRWRGARAAYRRLDPVEIERPVIAILAAGVAAPADRQREDRRRRDRLRAAEREQHLGARRPSRTTTRRSRWPACWWWSIPRSAPKRSRSSPPLRRLASRWSTALARPRRSRPARRRS